MSKSVAIGMSGVDALNTASLSIVSRLLRSSKTCLLCALLSSEWESICRSSLLRCVEHPDTGHCSCLTLTRPDCHLQRSTLSSLFLTWCTYLRCWLKPTTTL
jgi:hypothetical protein